MRPSDSEAQDGVVLRTVILCGGRGLGEIRGEGRGDHGTERLMASKEALTGSYRSKDQ